jgi:hypothetical protein
MNQPQRPKVTPLKRPGEGGPPLPPGRNRLGAALVEKGHLDAQGLERALQLQVEGEKTGRRFADILVDDLGLDRDLVFSELARLYAFREIDLSV